MVILGRADTCSVGQYECSQGVWESDCKCDDHVNGGGMVDENIEKIMRFQLLQTESAHVAAGSQFSEQQSEKNRARTASAKQPMEIALKRKPTPKPTPHVFPKKYLGDDDLLRKLKKAAKTKKQGSSSQPDRRSGISQFHDMPPGPGLDS